MTHIRVMEKLQKFDEYIRHAYIQGIEFILNLTNFPKEKFMFSQKSDLLTLFFRFFKSFKIECDQIWKTYVLKNFARQF